MGSPRGLVFFCTLLALISSLQAREEDIIDRFQLLDDKFRTEELLVPFGHNFIFDISVTANKNLFDVIDEGEKLSKKKSSNAEKLREAQDFLKKHSDSEQFVRATFNIGLPLPSFSLFEMDIRPNFIMKGSLGALLGLRSQRITADNIEGFLGTGVPPVLRAKLVERFNDIPEGTDIVLWLIQNDPDIEDNLVTRSFVGKYFMPAKAMETATIENYIKSEAKVGFYAHYKVNSHWDGFFNLYGLGRADFRVRADAQTVYQNSKILTDLPDKFNTTTFLAADYALRYSNKGFHLLLSIEDIEVSKISDNDKKGGKLLFDQGPLLRFHGGHTYDTTHFYLSPFAGVHKRKGYKTHDGLYGGLSVGLKTSSDNIGLYVRSQIDKEHLTLSPHMRLYFMRLGYTLKQPVTSKRNGIKLSAIHSAYLRLFF